VGISGKIENYILKLEKKSSGIAVKIIVYVFLKMK
jgi:hypothetical protein